MKQYTDPITEDDLGDDDEDTGKDRNGDTDKESESNQDKLKISKLEKQIKLLEETNAEYEKEIERLRKNINDCQTSKKDIQRDKDAEIKELIDKNKKIENELENAKKNNKDAQQIKEDLKDTIDKLDQLKKISDQDKEIIQTYITDIETFNKKIKEKDQKITDLQDQISTITNSLDDCKNNAKTDQDLIDKNTALNKKIIQLERDKETLKNRLELIDQQNEKCNKEKNKITSEIIDGLNQQITTLEEELKNKKQLVNCNSILRMLEEERATNLDLAIQLDKKCN